MKILSRIQRETLLLLAVALLTVVALPANAQYSKDLFNLKKASDLYDETGYQSSKSISVDGNISVSHGSGSANYVYPISDFTISGRKITTTLNYCNSVPFTAFKEYYDYSVDHSLDDGPLVTSDFAVQGSDPSWSQFNQNKPAWIIGVNGFAMQVLSTTDQLMLNPYFHSTAYTENLPYFSDQQMNWVINGYDYCNRMQTYVSADYATRWIDEIRLLRADGSMLTLRNVNDKNGNTLNDDSSYFFTGRYFSTFGANDQSYGIVEVDTVGANSQYMNYAMNTPASNPYSLLPRVLRYYPGDGLEYIFREYPNPYGNAPMFTEPSLRFGKLFAHPTIFYLVSINTSERKIVDFEYSKHQRRHTSASFGEISKGRALMLGFEGHKFTYAQSFMNIEALGRTTRVYYDDIPINYNGYNMNDAGATEDYSGKSYLSRVNKIIDPAGRNTDFTYESYNRVYKQFKFPEKTPDEIRLTNKRLTKVTGPDAEYQLTYYNPSTAIDITPSVINAQFPNTNGIYSITNVVNTLEKRAMPVGNTPGTLLSTETFAFTYPHMGSVADHSTVTIKDNITDSTKVIQNYYSHYSSHGTLDPWYSSNFTSLVRTSEAAGGRLTTTHTKYNSVGSTAFWKPVRKHVEVFENGNTYTLSLDSIRYRTQIVPSFGDRYKYMDSMFCIITVADTTKSFKPNDPNSLYSLLNVTVNNYSNLAHLDTTYKRYYIAWDKFASISNYLSYAEDRRNNGLPYVRWEDAPSSLHVFRRDSVTERIIAPPYLNIPLSTVQYNSTGTIIGGKKNILQIDVDPNRNYERGALIRDSIIGVGGVTVLGSEYTYRDYVRTLESTRNANGAVIFNNGYKNFYGLYSQGVIKANDNSTRVEEEKGSSIAMMFEDPYLQGQLVRKHNISTSGIDSVALTQSFQRTYYGLAKSVVDNNNWKSVFDYDGNGRIQTAWMPYDFQGNEMWSDRQRFVGRKEIAAFGFTNYSRWYDTCNGHVDTHVDSVVTSDESRLFASLPVTIIKPGCTPPDTSRASLGGGSSNTIQLNLSAWYYPRDQRYTGVIDSEFPDAYSLDSAYLRLYVTDIQGECVDLEVRFPGLLTQDNEDTTVTFVLNCNGTAVPSSLAKGGDNEEFETNNNSIQTTGENTYLTIKLNRYLEQIFDEKKLRAEIRVMTPGASVEFSNLADDSRSKFILVGDFRDTTDYTLSDFTLSYLYDYSGYHGALITSKVDDSLHTASSRWNTTPLDFSRRSTVHKFLDANNKLTMSVATIQRPNAAARLDTVKIATSGFGQALNVKDEEDYMSYTHYDGAGRVIKVTNADTTVVNKKYILGTETAFGITDQNFYGLVSADVTIDETGDTTIQYSDVYGRLRRERVKPTSLTELITRYEYNLQGQLTHVINPAGDTTKYWYDAFGRVQYKYQPDMGYLSYAYDKVGNVRYTQTQAQADSLRLTFMQYDDLNRVTVVGEAKISVGNDPNNPPVGEMSIGSGRKGGTGLGTGSGFGLTQPQTMAAAVSGFSTNFNLNRLSDILIPTSLHDNNVSGILTSNKSIWLTPVKALPPLLGAINTSTCLPGARPMEFLSDVLPTTLMKHEARQYQYQPWIAAPQSSFENLSLFPDHGLTVIHYDEMPQVRAPQAGSVWKLMPDTTTLKALAPKGALRNLKGHESAVAYRTHAGEPYHYVALSYDERGRAEALIRYTENIGYDAVYYTYNSMNAVTSVRVADAQRQYTTYYGYDANGRVDSVWTQLTQSGLGVITPTYPALPARPSTPDMIYAYTKRGQVDTLRYVPAGVVVDYVYNSRKLLDSMLATKGSTELFKQKLVYDSSGQITFQRSKQGSSPDREEWYTYDGINRLTYWVESNVIVESYGYDEVGNRLAATRGVSTTAYSYLDAQGPNRLSATANPFKQASYTYDKNGALSKKTASEDIGSMKIKSVERFRYSASGLVSQYRKGEVYLSSGACETIEPTIQQDWRYRYSAGVEREQKREYYGTQGNDATNGGALGWTYYLLSPDKKQLAVYHGIETRNTCSSSDTIVYLYPTEYLSYGLGSTSNITTKPDGTKEYKLQDHLGSTRATLSSTGIILSTTDYEPFGGVLASSGGELRLSFIDKENDKESSLGDFGVRKYDENDGRFTSIDPLWETFRDQTPYNYSENNPLRLKDPSGEGPDGYTPDFDDDDTGGTGGGGFGGPMGQNSSGPNQLGNELTPGTNEKRVGSTSAPINAGKIRTTGESANTPKSNQTTSTKTTSTPNKPSKVEKSTTTKTVGGKYIKTTEVRPSKQSPGQSRAEYVRVKNSNGKVVKTYKDSYDRGNKFQGRKPLTGGPEGRPKNE